MLEKNQIQAFLPHQGAMFLLNRVHRYDRDEIECSAISHRDPHNPLRHAEVLPIHAGIEYAAQAAGVHGGILNRDCFPDAPAQMGYLAVISNLSWSIARLDELPNELFIRARRTAVTSGGRAYRVSIEHAGQVILSGDLVIALEISSDERI